nr:dna polymerase type-x family protein pol4 [Quercus suber]
MKADMDIVHHELQSKNDGFTETRAAAGSYVGWPAKPDRERYTNDDLPFSPYLHMKDFHVTIRHGSTIECDMAVMQSRSLLRTDYHFRPDLNEDDEYTSSPAKIRTHGASPASKLDLSDLPPIFLSDTHFGSDELHEFEHELSAAGANLTYDINEAKIVLSRVTKKARARFDLREKGLWTEEVIESRSTCTSLDKDVLSIPAPKKRKVEQTKSTGKHESQAIVIEDSSTASEDEVVERSSRDVPERFAAASQEAVSERQEPVDLVKIVRTEWFEVSQKLGAMVPLEAFITYQGRPTTTRHDEQSPKDSSFGHSSPVTSGLYRAMIEKPVDRNDILKRAREDASKGPTVNDRFRRRTLGPGPKTLSANPGASWAAGRGLDSQYTQLLQQATTGDDEGPPSDLPAMPEWVEQGVKYACQRLTPKDSPNESFIALLKKISTARLLTNDDIGVRAYSTSIAAIAAYPYKLSSPLEIIALPGCDRKVANLFVEWTNTGKLKAVDDIEADADLRILHLFYNIWGVGATTARELYYDRGWTDLDDIVEYGWRTLTRVQQIGVKFYDEFLDLIPRAEVAQIGEIIHKHAIKVRDDAIQTMIVGGYRRGKDACGDVDVIVSHPDEEKTANLVNDIVASLEDEGWVTHTLLLSLNSSNRNQQTLPFKSGGGGHGFDSLDKALVVWQHPSWPSQGSDLAANPKAKNPNIHRRVDIIIAAWRAVGCAVVGWSGGTTFERDLRRYAKYAKGWKFDSSGVRDRGNGEVVDLERYCTNAGSERATTMLQAERRVFEGMDLIYREPWERCTG